MGWFSGKGDDRLPEERKVDVLQYKAYRAALNQNGERERRSGVRDETVTFWQLNSAVAETEKRVPWWRR